MIGRRAFITTALAAASGSAMAGSAETRHDNHAESPDGVVRRLYKDFAWEALFSDPLADRNWVGLLKQPRRVLCKYFTRHMADLLARDARCSRSSGEICRIDFLPIWSSQDPAAMDLIVSPAVDGTVEVAFKYPGKRDPMKLRYSVVRTTSGWRIANIANPNEGWSLNAILTTK
jgi:hypothetical protein